MTSKVVSCDLRCSSMWHGKKGFDRLLYACHNVLSEPARWICSFEYPCKFKCLVTMKPS